MRREIALLVSLLCLDSAGCIVDSPSPKTYCEQYPSDPACLSGGGGGGGSGTLSCDQPASTVPVLLPVPYQQQQCNELCWAAAISMSSQYFGISVAECQLASYRLQLKGLSYNCCATSMCYDAYCNQSAQAYEMANVLGNGLGMYGVLLQRALTESELQEELSNNRPVIIGFQGPFNGHAAVIVGFSPGSPSLYQVYDPWPTYGMLQATYAQIVQGPSSTPWIWSFTHQSRSASICGG